MTLKAAKETFAALMKKARGGHTLTQQERATLRHASQQIRADKRYNGNPRRPRRNPAGGNVMQPTEHARKEWLRMAADCERRGLPDTAYRFREYASRKEFSTRRYDGIMSEYRRWLIDGYVNERKRSNPPDLFGSSKPIEFEESGRPSPLARSSKEAAQMLGRGRRAELLKEQRHFDESRLEESPLFRGKGKQRLLGNPRKRSRRGVVVGNPGVLVGREFLTVADAKKLARVESYRLRSENGRRVRLATKVSFPDGRTIRFMDKLSKRAAITQAVEQLFGAKAAAENPPSLSQAVDARLMEIADIFEGGHSEHTGKLRMDEITREVTGRIGGVKKGFSELRHSADSPKVIAAAIRRGKGKVYDRVRAEVSRGLSRYYSERRRHTGKASVLPHERIRRYCTRCEEMHTRGQHRFHGVGSFHRTHMFGFGSNPAPRKIYDRILAIYAQKGYPHRCDDACKRARHRYVHKFTTKASIFGLADGSIIVKPAA